MEDIFKELQEIGKLIESANLVNEIRNEVHGILKDEGAIVLGGIHSDDYDVIIKNCKKPKAVARRLKRSVSNIQVDELVDNIVGIRTARRGNK